MALCGKGCFIFDWNEEEQTLTMKQHIPQKFKNVEISPNGNVLVATTNEKLFTYVKQSDGQYALHVDTNERGLSVLNEKDIDYAIQFSPCGTFLCVIVSNIRNWAQLVMFALPSEVEKRLNASRDSMNTLQLIMSRRTRRDTREYMKSIRDFLIKYEAGDMIAISVFDPSFENGIRNFITDGNEMAQILQEPNQRVMMILRELIRENNTRQTTAPTQMTRQLQRLQLRF